MKKTFSFRLLTLLAVLVLAAAHTGLALAESPVCPVNAPPAMGQYTTGWQLYSGSPIDYHITLAVDEETGLRSYTLHDCADWGIATAAMGTWQYDAASSGWVQTQQGGGQVLLELSDADYADLGFPAWKAPCVAGADALVVNIYLGQVRQLYTYVDYLFGDNSISITAEDHSFVISLSEESDAAARTSFASYDPCGILAYASYSEEAPDGSMTAWRLEAVPAQESYRLTSIMHADAQGNTCYWEQGQWQNADFVKVEAPEGISHQDVPYTLSGEWLGIPFAQPGDAPEGTFPAGEQATDNAMQATDYKPWPDSSEALYKNWAEGKAVPAMPQVRWETLEDDTVAFTLTGVERWGVQDAHQCDWRWHESESDWQPEGEPTPGQMRFLVSAEMTDLYWEQPAQAEGMQVLFSLNRENLLQEAGMTSLAGNWSWQVDNRGGLIYSRQLDETRTLTAEYDGYRLLQYDILTVDESGVPVSQTCYDAPDDAPDTYTLHLYYHYSENVTEEALWLRNIGWYSYETGKPCEGPEGVVPENCLPLTVE